MTDTHVPTWTLGDRLRKAREDAHITQEQMAQELFVARSTLTAWERDANKRGVPRLALLRWAELTAVPPWWLMGEPQPGSPAGNYTDINAVTKGYPTRLRAA